MDIIGVDNSYGRKTMEQFSDNLKNLEHLDFLLYAKLAHLEDMIEIATDDAEKLLVDIRSFKASK